MQFKKSAQVFAVGDQAWHKTAYADVDYLTCGNWLPGFMPIAFMSVGIPNSILAFKY